MGSLWEHLLVLRSLAPFCFLRREGCQRRVVRCPRTTLSAIVVASALALPLSVKPAHNGSHGEQDRGWDAYQERILSEDNGDNRGRENSSQKAEKLTIERARAVRQGENHQKASQCPGGYCVVSAVNWLDLRVASYLFLVLAGQIRRYCIRW